MSDFHQKAMIANVILRDYGTILIYRTHFQYVLEPFLKRELRIGWWKRGFACSSYFNNLFMAGMLMGMMHDLPTG